MTPGYPYDQGDRLAQPCSYMYTPYQGPGFLKAHRDSRDQCRAALEAALLAAGPLLDEEAQLLGLGLQLWRRSRPWEEPPPLLARLGPVPPPGRDRRAARALERLAARDLAQAQATWPILADLLRLLGPEPLPPAAASWLERLLGRFEVKKHLHQAYQPGFRRGMGSRELLELYAGLALALGWQHLATGDLALLNGLLKLDDLLCSLAPRLAGWPWARAAAWLALHLEQAAVKDLMARLELS